MGAFEENYKLAVERPSKVLEIFNDFFTEERVDLQGLPSLEECTKHFNRSRHIDVNPPSVDTIKDFCNTQQIYILVHFPHVRVTNEYDKYTDVFHLYAKVAFDINGAMEGRFTLNRSEYSIAHMSNNYMHSHVSQIPFGNFTEFQTPCTGSGPINNTICSLSAHYDEDLWRLFCLELSKFVEVESISGTPYHRLESIGMGGRNSVVYDEFTYMNELHRYHINKWRSNLRISQLAEFIKYLIDKDVLKFSFNGYSYKVAFTPTELYIRISNAFIDWYNKQFNEGKAHSDMAGLLSTNLVERLIFSEGKLLRNSDGRTPYYYLQYVGQPVCLFKGQTITVQVTGISEETNTNEITVLSKEICDYIVTKIINVLNFRYGNDKCEDSSGEEVRFL